MEIKYTGGPAFPQRRMYRDSQGIDHEIQEVGMSLRDYFAGQALTGIMAWKPTKSPTPCSRPANDPSHHPLPRHACHLHARRVHRWCRFVGAVVNIPRRDLPVAALVVLAVVLVMWAGLS